MRPRDVSGRHRLRSSWSPGPRDDVVRGESGVPPAWISQQPLPAPPLDRGRPEVQRAVGSLHGHHPVDPSSDRATGTRSPGRTLARNSALAALAIRAVATKLSWTGTFGGLPLNWSSASGPSASTDVQAEAASATTTVTSKARTGWFPRPHPLRDEPSNRQKRKCKSTHDPVSQGEPRRPTSRSLCTRNRNLSSDHERSRLFLPV